MSTQLGMPQAPTLSEGEELTQCPICGGPTKLLGENIFCPSCNIIISNNLSDTLKAKVAMIKGHVSTKKAQEQSRKQLPKTVAGVVIQAVVVIVVLGVLALSAIPIYHFMRAKGYENAAQYAQAAQSYDQANRPIALPFLTQEAVRMHRLAASAAAFEQGQQLIKQQEYAQAIEFFNQVDPLDRHYSAAQVLRREAELKLTQ